MTDITPATRAREAALSVEAKKHALRQQQDGCWIMTLRVHQNDMPEAIMKAAMGTRYQVAMVEIGDDELPVSQRATVPPTSSRPAGDKPGPATTNRVPAEPVRAAKEKRQFSQIAAAQQAGILCGEPSFSVFLAEKFPKVWGNTCEDPAATVREICEVNSRADLTPDNALWSSLVLAYRLWMNHPEYVG